MMEFSNDELIVMMLYSPGSRPRLILALEEMKGQFTPADTELSALVASILPKLEAMTDEEFDRMSICPDF